MAYRLATDTRNKACDAVVDDIDAGSGAGTILFGTSLPGSVGGSYGTTLGTCTFSDPAFGAAANGVATASAITSDTNADNSGTAVAAHIRDSDGNSHSDCACGTSGSDINFDNNVIVSGGVIAVSSLTVTQPI